jgi:hypothetical protein
MKYDDLQERTKTDHIYSEMETETPLPSLKDLASSGTFIFSCAAPLCISILMAKYLLNAFQLYNIITSPFCLMLVLILFAAVRES